MLAVKVRKAQDELRAAQKEISTLWEERQELNRELVGGEE
jgi:exonuclease VII small subunit